MEELFNDLRKLISIESVCEKNASYEYPFGRGVRLALDSILEICEEYGFRTKTRLNAVRYNVTKDGWTNSM